MEDSCVAVSRGLEVTNASWQGGRGRWLAVDDVIYCNIGH